MIDPREIEDLRLDILLGLAMRSHARTKFLKDSMLRKFDCFRLRRDGLTYNAIGKKVGLSDNRVMQNIRWINQALNRRKHWIKFRASKMIHCIDTVRIQD